MKKTFKYTLFTISLTSILMVCVSVTASIADTASVVRHTLSEPLNILLFGVALIGLGSYIKNRMAN